MEASGVTPETGLAHTGEKSGSRPASEVWNRPASTSLG